MKPELTSLDPLTGVYTRANLQQRLTEELNQAARNRVSFSMILLDIDHFKSINDAFGHQRGDQVLIEFSQRLRTMIRSSDILVRYGGDEFLVLLPNTSKTQAVLLAERLIKAIHSEPVPGSPPLNLSMSLGVATYPEDGVTPESLFDEVDLRQYEAKRRGRGQLVSERSEQEQGIEFMREVRLLERDDALATLNRFLRLLPDQKKGLLLISGRPAAGQNRFLQDVGKAARLQGYEVAVMAGNPALARRTYGAMTQAFKDWDLPNPQAGLDAFAQALQKLVDERNRAGLFVTCSNIYDFDWPTVEFLRGLFTHPALTRLGIAATTQLENDQRIFLTDTALIETIQLKPLSQESVRIFLRSGLHWEPPSTFVRWLWSETDGLPGSMEATLQFMIEKGLLSRENEHWKLQQNYARKLAHLAGDHGQHLRAPHLSGSLPIPPTYFLGRDREIQIAKEMLGEERLVTVTGPGGVGKTRLALQTAAELSASYPNGVYFIPLSAISSGEFLASSIADILGISFYHKEEPAVQLLNYLSTREILLVLDNFEHLLTMEDTSQGFSEFGKPARTAGLLAGSGPELVARMLETAPRLRLLVTSRERLNLRGEAVVELTGMQFPTTLPLQQLEQFPAVQLFTARARQAQPGFTLTETEAPYVARICQLVEGLPLGLELAAAWLSMLSCKEIIQEIEKNLDFLSTSVRDLPERHRSLRAVFESSWGLLGDAEQNVLCQLTVFKGGFRREAATAVAGANLNLLTSLINKSLLYRQPDAMNQPRYHLHDVVGVYASEKLQRYQRVQRAASDRHADYYASFMAQMNTKLKGNEQKAALEQLRVEIENIRTAWLWALETQNLEAIEKSAECLFAYYEINGLFQEGAQAFEQAVENLKDSTVPNTGLIALLVNRQGTFYHKISNYSKARACYEKSRELLENSLAPSLEMAYLMLRMSQLAQDSANHQEARRQAEHSLVIYQELEDTQGIGRALNQLGGIYYGKGEYDASRKMYQKALTLYESTNDLWGIERTLVNLGNALSDLGERDAAQQAYRQSLAICEELGDQVGRAVLLNNLGDFALETGDLSEAGKLLRESLDLYEQIGDRVGQGISLSNLGEVAYRAHEYDEAKRLFQRGLELNRSIHLLSGEAYSLYQLGLVAAATECFDEARLRLGEALGKASACQYYPLLSMVLVEMAGLLMNSGELERAAAILVVLQHERKADPGTRQDTRTLLDRLQERLPAETIHEIHLQEETTSLETLAQRYQN